MHDTTQLWGMCIIRKEEEEEDNNTKHRQIRTWDFSTGTRTWLITLSKPSMMFPLEQSIHINVISEAMFSTVILQSLLIFRKNKQSPFKPYQPKQQHYELPSHFTTSLVTYDFAVPDELIVSSKNYNLTKSVNNTLT